MAMHCACGKQIIVHSDMGAITSIGSLKFYASASMFGHPSSRQKVFFCDIHTQQFIDWLTNITGASVVTDEGADG